MTIVTSSHRQEKAGGAGGHFWQEVVSQRQHHNALKMKARPNAAQQNLTRINFEGETQPALFLPDMPTAYLVTADSAMSESRPSFVFWS